MEHDSYTNFYQDCTDNEMLNFLETHTPSSLQNLDFNINPNLFLEMLLNDIKNVTISYSVQKNREINLEEKTLFENLKRAKNDVMENDSDTSRHNLADIENKYDAFMDKKAKDFILNRNTEMKIQGEKPNSFFCLLEKNSASQKYIPKLDISEGRGEKKFITEQGAIEKELSAYYKNLFSNNEKNITPSPEEFLDNDNDHVKLNDKEALEIEGAITEEELGQILKKTKNDSSPGASGFNYNFYKFFWAIKIKNLSPIGDLYAF